MMARRLEPAKIVETLERLAARIGERFPQSGLAGVCAELVETGRATAAAAEAIARPNLWLRLGIGAVIIGGIAGQIAAARTFRLGAFSGDPANLVQGLDAAVNLLLLAAGAVWFLLTLEERLKRRRALADLHELRSFAHVVDMHQLTKDPTLVLGAFHKRTKASIARPMSEFELTRYLEYCSEMLALIGKLAALYGQDMRDAVVIEAVNDIENLTAGLSRKVWQKITIVKQLDEAANHG
jgi:hypothetical protein